MLDICITVKNRSRVELEDGSVLELFPKCIESINKSISELFLWDKVKVIVSDFGSYDYPLEKWIYSTGANLNISVLNASNLIFNRGKGLNIAASYGAGDQICFLDTDMICGKEFFTEGISSAKIGECLFPICFSFYDKSHSTGWWRDTGFGMSFVSRHDYINSGGIPEYQSWGMEDSDFYHKLLSRSVKINRKKIPNFFHQWHPNDLAWKEKYLN